MIYEKNMDCIKEKRKYLYTHINDIDLSLTPKQIEDIRSAETKDGEKVITLKLNEKEWRLNSPYSPLKEAKKWVEQFEFNNLNNAISMFGFGNGIFARAIIEKMGKNDVLLIYEPSPDIFFHVLHNYDITDILSNPRVSISIEKINEFEFHNDLRNIINLTNMNGQNMCVYPQYDKMFSESCIGFWKEIKETYIYAKTNVNTEIAFGKRFIENELKNIKFLNNSNTLREVKNVVPTNIPAIIVAAGPSVEKQINELKRAKGKAVIFAVDRILDYLLDNGVIADFVVTVDPTKKLEHFSKRNDVTVPLICFLDSNYEILDRHKGKKIICNCNHFLDKVYMDCNKIPPNTPSSSSVATLTFTVCVEMGFEKIILVGQDLAYIGESSHAGGGPDNNLIQRDLMIEDIDGNQIRSRTDWKEFVIWYQDMLTLNTKLKVIDAKDAGAKIKGTTVMPLQEAIDTYCNSEYSYNEAIDNLEPTFDAKGRKHIKEYLNDNLETLKTIRLKSKDAIKACDSLIKESKKTNLETKTAKDAHNKIAKISEYILEQPIYSLMDHYITATTAQHLSEMYQFTGNIKEDSQKTYDKSKIIFRSIIDGVDFVRPLLEDSMKEL
jgi:hypothetical protein